MRALVTTVVPVTIRKGEPWGHPGPLPEGAPVAESDADLARMLAEGASERRWSGRVLSGDLLRTVGGSAELRPEPHHLPIDLGWVSCDDGEPMPFVAHVIAHRRWWRGEGAAVMNAAWLGTWYLGPRSHPNDGLLDVTVGRLPLQQRLEARRRAPSGTHVPHPDLTVRRVPRWEHAFARPTPVWVDGVRAGSATTLSCWLDDDAFTLIV